ncbi:hypothetical protein F511_41423 [Dorcoceras hygrometricum]|uniref:Uncharacterized protein n=1 Tax=Dorcoceras hygrometricum TaxID=472368 RepID=A0A2Z7A6P2_9LAMI|nr:hypothetical protein F511_41423 [Dorcoceras hygrometricum]
MLTIVLDKDLEYTIVYVRCDSGYDGYHETRLIVTVRLLNQSLTEVENVEAREVLRSTQTSPLFPLRYTDTKNQIAFQTDQLDVRVGAQLAKLWRVGSS